MPLRLRLSLLALRKYEKSGQVNKLVLKPIYQKISHHLVVPLGCAGA